MGVNLKTESTLSSQVGKPKPSASKEPIEPETALGLHLADVQLIRLRILNHLSWPLKTRHFVTCVAAMAHGRIGWFSYGHLFMADLIGVQGTADSKRKAVQRVLCQYEFDAIEADHDLFEFRRGGGKKQSVTQYGKNHLNLAADWVNRQLASCSILSSNLTVLIDEFIPEAVANFLPSRKTRIWRSKKKTIQPKIHYKNFQSHGGKPLTQGTVLSPSSKQEAAADLAALGFRVFPLHSPGESRCSCRLGGNCSTPGKHPRVQSWGQAATTNLCVISEWWTKWPDANIGVRTGIKLSDGGFLVVLDVDRRSFGHGSLASWQDEIVGPWVETFTVTTGDGFQHYYSVTDGLPNSKNLLGCGLDVKGHGGYVVGPGSAHFNGKTYTVTNARPIEPMPELMVSFLRNLHSRHFVPIGERHEFLTRCARRLAIEGLQSDEIIRVLEDRLNRFCELGGRLITREELSRLAGWAQKLDAGREVRIEIA